MGYSLPASIGACLANNKKRTICLEGDGSIMMNLQELQTVVHYNLPIKIFVINNNGYISIKQTQNNFFQGNLTGCSKDSGVSMPNFTKISEAFGLKTFTIKNPENILSLISSALEYDGPVLCNVIVETDYTFTPKLLSQQLEDGTIVSPSFENMYPFLSKQELSECLYK